ncbi:MAG: hypothetical protein KDA90_10500 [Planctomycetaceae bacterium]|nr:hypothetical protein [Planctomycetaceae bacterium]
MTDLAQQETAARNAAACCPLTDWTLLEITGPDRQRFLHSFCTQDIKGMPENSVREAFVTNVKGRLLGHLVVFNEPERLTLLTVPDAAAGLLRHLQMYLLGLEAEIRDVSTERAAVCLLGPQVAAAIPAAAITVPAELNTLQTQSVPAGEVTAACVDLFNIPAWLLLFSRDTAGDVGQSLQQAGLVQVDEVVFELMRIEAGFPWYGRDLSDDHIAQESARTDQAINFKKGCYLGQEPIARLDAMGHTNRELRAIQIEGHPAIAVGAEVRSGETTIGALTSVAKSASFGDTVALGVLKVRQAAPGANVEIAGMDGAVVAGRVCWPAIER